MSLHFPILLDLNLKISASGEKVRFFCHCQGNPVEQYIQSKDNGKGYDVQQQIHFHKTSQIHIAVVIRNHKIGKQNQKRREDPDDAPYPFFLIVCCHPADVSPDRYVKHSDQYSFKDYLGKEAVRFIEIIIIAVREKDNICNVIDQIAVCADQAAPEMSQNSASGDTPVTGRVEETDTGNVEYVVSVPDKIDFGTLKKPDTGDAGQYATRYGTVKLESVENLPDGCRIAVFVKDAADTAENPDFRIIGQDYANQGKELVYTITNQSSQANLLSGTRYLNGYLVGAFVGAGDNTNLQLDLDRQQLYGVDLSEWTGNYKGTLNFYSKVVDLTSLK